MRKLQNHFENEHENTMTSRRSTEIARDCYLHNKFKYSSNATIKRKKNGSSSLIRSSSINLQAVSWEKEKKWIILAQLWIVVSFSHCWICLEKQFGSETISGRGGD